MFAQSSFSTSQTLSSIYLHIKKHGTILYQSGRELECLLHAVFSLKNYKEASNQLYYTGVYKDLNRRIFIQAKQCKLSNGLLDVEHQIQSSDPILWDMVCVITQSAKDKHNHRHLQVYDGEIENRTHLFILHISFITCGCY